MDVLSTWGWALDGWIIAAGSLCAVAASLLGNFLILRKMSLLGDAITHAVLPGIAIAFFISGSRHSLPMFVGAVIAGIMTAIFTEWVRGAGDVDEGASMGVVFTSLFALGLVMIVQSADNVHLDADCVLYGAIELTPLDTVPLGSWNIPRAVLTLAAVTLLNGLFVLFFYKELKISSFDPALATTTGFHARIMHYLLMILVAITAVASFEAVGNILVVAMMIVPPAAAYLLTDRLSRMIGISLLLAVVAAVTGHLGALLVPSWFGYQSTTTAGMMAVSAGLILLAAAAFSPRHGVLVKWFQHRILAGQILADDVMGLLYRIDERDSEFIGTFRELQSLLLVDRYSLNWILIWLQARRRVKHVAGRYELTDSGRATAQKLVRSHRLWEQYLVSYAGVDSDRLHKNAEQFEHFTDQSLRNQLDAETNTPKVDPHGSAIPDEMPRQN